MVRIYENMTQPHIRTNTDTQCWTWSISRHTQAETTQWISETDHTQSDAIRLSAIWWDIAWPLNAICVAYKPHPYCIPVTLPGSVYPRPLTATPSFCYPQSVAPTQTLTTVHQSMRTHCLLTRGVLQEECLDTRLLQHQAQVQLKREVCSLWLSHCSQVINIHTTAPAAPLQ